MDASAEAAVCRGPGGSNPHALLARDVPIQIQPHRRDLLDDLEEIEYPTTSTPTSTTTGTSQSLNGGGNCEGPRVLCIAAPRLPALRTWATQLQQGEENPSLVPSNEVTGQFELPWASCQAPGRSAPAGPVPPAEGPSSSELLESSDSPDGVVFKLVGPVDRSGGYCFYDYAWSAGGGLSFEVPIR